MIMLCKLKEELAVMPSDKQVLMEKIQALPPERIAEIEDFVDFLAGKTRRLEAADRRLYKRTSSMRATGTGDTTASGNQRCSTGSSEGVRAP